MNTADDLQQLGRGDLRDLYDELTQAIVEIDVELSVRKPIERLTNAEFKAYRDWRRSALHAKTAKLKERRQIKALLRVVLSDQDDDVTEMSQAIIEALGIQQNDQACGQVYGAVRRILDSWDAGPGEER